MITAAEPYGLGPSGTPTLAALQAALAFWNAQNPANQQIPPTLAEYGDQTTSYMALLRDLLHGLVNIVDNRGGDMRVVLRADRRVRRRLN